MNQNFVTGGSLPCGIALAGSSIYWGNEGANDDSIGRASLDGSGVDEQFIKGAAAPAGLAVEGSKLYWANGTTPPPVVKITSAPKHNSRPRTARSTVRFAWISDERLATYKCQLDSGRLKPCRSPTAYTVALGDHTFTVQATDQGTVGVSAPYKFQLKSG